MTSMSRISERPVLLFSSIFAAFVMPAAVEPCVGYFDETASIAEHRQDRACMEFLCR